MRVSELLVLLFAVALWLEADAAKKRCKASRSILRKAAKYDNPKAMKCLRKYQKKKFSRLEKEFQGEMETRVEKCFDDEGHGACGSSADIKSQDMFNLGAPFFRRCFHCGMYMQFLGSVYFTAKTGKKRNKVRSCVNQILLDEVSKRSKAAKEIKIWIQLMEVDNSAVRHVKDMRKSTSLALAWRTQVDNCEDKDAAERIRQCMIDGQRKNTPKFCRALKNCRRKVLKKKKNKTCKRKNSARVQRKICDKFYGAEENYMRGMRSVLATVRERAEEKGASGFDAKKDCDQPIRAELKAMLPYGRGKNKVDWLHHFKIGMEKCRGESLDPYEWGITMACEAAEARMKDSGGTSIQPIQDMIFFITNLSSSIMDRIARYCRCKT